MFKGIPKIGEADKEFNPKAVTSTFYRLEKRLPSIIECYDVYEFYKVKQNGFMYCRHHEEPIGIMGNRTLGAIFRDVKFGYGEKARQDGNNKYKELLKKGYVFVGVFECDICGYSKRIA